MSNKDIFTKFPNIDESTSNMVLDVMKETNNAILVTYQTSNPIYDAAVATDVTMSKVRHLMNFDSIPRMSTIMKLLHECDRVLSIRDDEGIHHEPHVETFLKESMHEKGYSNLDMERLSGLGHSGIARLGLYDVSLVTACAVANVMGMEIFVEDAK